MLTARVIQRARGARADGVTGRGEKRECVKGENKNKVRTTGFSESSMSQ